MASTGRTVLAAFAILSLLMSAFAIARPVSADHTAAGSLVLVPSSGANAECIGFDWGYKLDMTPPNGTHTYTYVKDDVTLFSVKITGNAAGTSVSFSDASLAVSRFVIAGGTEADAVHTYNPPVTAAGPYTRTQQISHVSFCGFFPPEITVDKTGGVLSKIGDEVDYTITITNVSASITAHKWSITDTLAGDLTGHAGCGASLAPGAHCTIEYTLTVPMGASDPWDNTVTAIYTSQAGGAGGQATETDSHSVNLFQPGVSVDKTGPTTAEVGDTITYVITVTNTSSADSPNLVIDTVNDTLLDNAEVLAALEAAGCDDLAAGAPACQFSVDYTVQEGDPDPLPNTVTLTYNPTGFPNEIVGSDDHSVVIEEQLPDQGSITVVKEVDCEVCETLTIGYWFNAAGVHDEHADALFAAAGGISADGTLFTSAAQVRAYVKADIAGDDGQPGLSKRGQLTIQYLAASLNVLNDEDCELAEQVYSNPASPFDGWKVALILAEAEKAFAGTSTYSDEEIKDALDEINNSTQLAENPLSCDSAESGVLDGVTFDIYTQADYESDPQGTATDSGTTGDHGSGTVVFSGLTIGETYVIVESGFPEGVTCEIVGVSGGDASLVGGVIYVTLDAESNLTLTVENECEEEQVEELGSLLIAKEDDAGALLGGATFEVDGSEYADTDEDGFVCVDGLTLGSTVSVEETIAPAGYIGEEGARDIPILSDQDCDARLAGSDPQADADATFVNVAEGEEVAAIELIKVDQEGTELSDAVFKLYLDDGDDVFDPEDGSGGGGDGGGGADCTGDANVAPADAATIASAIMADATTLNAASFAELPPTGTPNGTADCLSWFPTHGGSFGILTTGDVNLADTPNTDEGSGVSLGGNNVRGDTDYDVTVLKLDLTTPSGANCLQFDFAFYSEEFPEYVGSSFNDAFIAEFGSSTWTTSGSTISAPNNFAFDPDGNVISINSTGATAMTAANADGTTYDGATVLLTAATPVGAGTNSLFLSIFDQGDDILDSAVFIDNVRFITVADVSTQCVAGAQEASPGGDELISTKSTDEDGSALFSGLVAGTYWLQETTAPDGCEIVDEVTKVVLTEADILAGEPKVVTVENDCEEDTTPGGGTQPGGGGPSVTPREGTRGGTTVPDTATSPILTGSIPAVMLTLLMLTGLGAAGYAMQVEARRRR